jgi:hypothetical protein
LPLKTTRLSRRCAVALSVFCKNVSNASKALSREAASSR